jgi:hypothetical protein
MSPDTVIVIHYHLLPGGVCSAIKNSVVALAQSGWFSHRSLRVLTGRAEGVEEFRQSLSQWSIRVEIEVDERLDYSNQIWPDRDTFWTEAKALSAWFLGQARGESLYWVHNPTLGKNALVTSALMVAGQKGATDSAAHRFLYHIHDFAECGRLRNLMQLRNCWGDGGIQEFYPVGNNFGYGILNSADRHRLARAGVPEERIFLLPNAVLPVNPERSTDKKIIGLELQRYARGNNYRFEPGNPWWVLPIRLIRRKNVLEALLLAATSEVSPQLLITLDANSEPERPYAEAVKGLVREENFAAVVGFGHELVGRTFGFDDLLLASDVVVTTSLLEGFGFAFLEGANRGKPLVGRNLNDVTRDFVATGFPASSLYSRFLVPVAAKIRKEMIDGGRHFAREKGVALGMSPARVDAFVHGVETIFSEDAVDFGFLNLHQQLELTRWVHRDSFVRDLSMLNPGAAEPAEFPADFSIRLEEQFGMHAHASRLAAAFEGLFVHDWEESAPREVSRQLLDLYFQPRFHRPLLGEW